MVEGGMFERRVGIEEQKDFWIMAGELPEATPDAFYRRVNATLEKIGFAKEVWGSVSRLMRMPLEAGGPGSIRWCT